MSTLMDGINNIYSLTAQINSLKSMDQTKIDDPDAIKYALEQNFSNMLDDLVSATSDNDDKEEDNNDYFSFLTSSNQASLQSLQAQGILETSDVQAILGNSYEINSSMDFSSPEYLNSLYNLSQLQ